MKKLVLALVLAVSMAACAKKEESQPKPQSAVLITEAKAEVREIEMLETTVGSLEVLMDPTVGAEVAGRVVQVLAHAGQRVRRGQLIAVLDAQDYALQKREAEAEILRLQALLDNQGRIVTRNQRLVQQNYISRNVLEDAETEQASLRQQLEGARARLATITHNDAKTRVISPLAGQVEKQIVSVGDYVKVGDPLFQLVGPQRLRAHLPFPETVASSLRAGQKVRLSTPTAPADLVTTQIKEIKPLIDSGSRAVDAIVDVVDRPGWHAGASVNGAVVLGRHDRAVMVPEQSVVLRPAGAVVYVIEGGLAHQRIVTVGQRDAGLVEILTGLSADESVAVDGAGYLTDQARIKVQQASQP